MNTLKHWMRRRGDAPANIVYWLVAAVLIVVLIIVLLRLVDRI
jgi:uncharacterized membrane protein YidH (DUF202 family)